MSKKFNCVMCIAAILLFLGNVGWGATIYVAPDGDDVLGDGTQKNPYATIQKGVDEAGDGDTVEVAEGTYEEAVVLKINVSITLTGTDPNDWSVVSGTVIDAGGGVAYAIIYMGRNAKDPVDIVIKGLTVKNSGYGILICDNTENANVVISNCISENNSSYGMGLEGNNNILVKNCIIRNNPLWGIYIPTVQAGPPVVTVENTLIYACNYGIFFLGGELTVRNCTIVGCEDSGICDPYGPDPQILKISNCIVWNNDDDLDGCVATYSCIEDGDVGSGNISDDPSFVDSENDNFRLTADSPCIDKGDPNASYEGEYDLDGENRFNYPYVDMGAYEWYGCYIVGEPRGYLEATITEAHYDVWLYAGMPDAWCCGWQPVGDTNGDGYINPSDYALIVAHPAEPAINAPCADTNHDGWINPSDFIAIIQHYAWGDGEPCAACQ